MAERLTKYLENGDVHYNHGEKLVFNTDILKKLAAYEDLGTVEELAELVAAKQDNRLAVLPDIKLYKTLYWIWGGEIMPVKYMGVRGGCVDSNGNYHVNCRMKTLKDRTFLHSVHRKPREFSYKAGDERYFYADDLGKTIFLTREEAEAALSKEGVPNV